MHTVLALIYCIYKCIAASFSSCFVKHIQHWKTFQRKFAFS